MTTLRDKIATLKTIFLDGRDSLFQEEFANCKENQFSGINVLVFQALKPDYELSDEDVTGIFQMSDENNVIT